MQALRAVGVFGLSHIMYCGDDNAQCFTSGKLLSTFIVIGGVLSYSFAKKRHLNKGGITNVNDDDDDFDPMYEFRIISQEDMDLDSDEDELFNSTSSLK
jgi:hypothetical protein